MWVQKERLQREITNKRETAINKRNHEQEMQRSETASSRLARERTTDRDSHLRLRERDGYRQRETSTDRKATLHY